MLRIFILGIIVCISNLLSAQNMATVECRLEKGLKLTADNKVSLYEVKKGKTVEKATGICSGGEGYFAFTFRPDYEGFYVVGEASNYYYPVWVKPGETVSIYLRRGGHAEFYGKKNSPENEILNEWLALSDTVCNMSTHGYLFRGLTALRFFDALEKWRLEADEFKKNIRTKNDLFNEKMSRYVDYQKDYYALNYIFTPKPANFNWKEMANLPSFYSNMTSEARLDDEVILDMPEGFRLLRFYVSHAARLAGKGVLKNDLDVVVSQCLKGELAVERISMQRSVYELKKMMKDYAPFLSEEQSAEAESYLKKLEEQNARQRTVDFSFPDVNGKIVSLSDFQGKIVLLDIWATWCGPCREQLPYLKKLEEEMQGTDLVVIGVSTDVRKDYDKWEKMVESGEVAGIQLFADGGRQLKADYKVNGIPRFIVFDRQGKVYEVNAPRPSDPGLKELLNELLKK